MGNRWKLLIGILIFATAATAAIIGSALSERVPLNDAGIVGNRPGNIINGGYFCELDGKVYFSNVDDNHTLYSMNPDESHVRRLGSMGVSQICGAGRLLYLYMNSSQYSSGKGLGYVGNTYGIYRYRIKNGKTSTLERARPQMMQLCGSYLYFAGASEDGNGTYKVRIDKKDRRRISDSIILPAGYDGRYLYYSGANGDPSLYYLNTPLGDMESKVLDGNVSSPIPAGDFVYYIDNAQDYRICRLNRTTGAAETISTERVDCYNTNGNYIWYATSTEDVPALKRMDTNGSNVVVIAEGIYNSINLTSRYVYFSPFDKNGLSAMLHIPVESVGPAARFSPVED